MNKLISAIKPLARSYGLYAAFALALISTLMSLYMSDIMNLVPCTLCWWGRVFMYPLVFIIVTGILKRDDNVVYYSAPFVLSGIFLGAYHSLLQWKIIPEVITSCKVGIPCNEVTWQLFGFVTIPFLEFLAFVGIGICLYAFYATRPAAD